MTLDLWLAGCKWTVKYSSRVPRAPSNKSKWMPWGYMDADARVIVVNNKIGKQNQAQSLMHELIHAISWEHSDIDPLGKLFPNDVAVERLAKDLSGAMFQLNAKKRRTRRK